MDRSRESGSEDESRIFKRVPVKRMAFPLFNCKKANTTGILPS